MTVLTAVLQTIHDLSFWGMAIVLFAALGGLIVLFIRSGTRLDREESE